jgi:uncharacterized damage-inducible protein DinB
MIRRVADFEKIWKRESETTATVLAALTDASLTQPVTPRDRTLGELAWHVATSVAMMSRAGLAVAAPAEDAPCPATAREIHDAYVLAATSVLEQVVGTWTDQTLAVEDDMYGEAWPRGMTLLALVLHEAHHRGAMTVLMRQAGLVVPGIYGPNREQSEAIGIR